MTTVWNGPAVLVSAQWIKSVWVHRRRRRRSSSNRKWCLGGSRARRVTADRKVVFYFLYNSKVTCIFTIVLIFKYIYMCMYTVLNKYNIFEIPAALFPFWGPCFGLLFKRHLLFGLCSAGVSCGSRSNPNKLPDSLFYLTTSNLSYIFVEKWLLRFTERAVFVLKDRIAWIMAEDEGFVVRVRGLPWSCSVDEVARFFSGENNVLLTAYD